MKPIHFLAIAGLTTSSLAGTSFEESVMATESTKDWWLAITPYGWVAATEGDMGIAGRVAPVDISMKDTLDNLDIAFMLAAEAGINRWVFGIDGIYGAFSSDADVIGRAVRASVDFDQFFARAHAGYQLINEDTMTLSAFAGARYSYLSSDLSLIGPRGRTLFSSENSKSWVDPIVGMRGLWEFTDRWIINGGGDIGGFGASSDLIWQANLGVGYRWNDQITLLAGYRGLGVDYQQDGFLVDTVAHGPVLGMTCRF